MAVELRLRLRLRRWFEVDGFGGDERRRERFATESRAEREVRREAEREFGVGGGEREAEEISCSCHFWT